MLINKKINKLINKIMSNIRILECQLLLRKNGVLKKLCLLVSFWEPQLTQVLLNFKTSCCNLKIRRLGAKLCVAFLLF